MLNSIELSRYYSGNSYFHKINPVSKIISILFFTIASILNNNIYFHLILIIILLINMFISNIPIKLYFKSLKIFRIFIISIFIINLILGMDIINNIIQLFRLLELTIFSSIVVMTTNRIAMQDAIGFILSPLTKLGINVSVLSFIVSYSIKFIPIILDLINSIIRNIEIRGMSLKNANIKNKMIIIKAIIFPLFYLSFKYADDLSDIMSVRLYDINKNSNYDINWKKKDYFLIMIYIFILVLSIIWR